MVPLFNSLCCQHLCFILIVLFTTSRVEHYGIIISLSFLMVFRCGQVPFCFDILKLVATIYAKICSCQNSLIFYHPPPPIAHVRSSYSLLLIIFLSNFSHATSIFFDRHWIRGFRQIWIDGGRSPPWETLPKLLRMCLIVL